MSNQVPAMVSSGEMKDSLPQASGDEAYEPVLDEDEEEAFLAQQSDSFDYESGR